MSKLDTARAIVNLVKTLAPMTDYAEAMEAEYFDVGAFADEDVASIGMTAADLSACVTIVQQMRNLMTNQTVTEAMYRVTLNKVRRLTT